MQFLEHLLGARYSECGLFRIGVMSKKNQDLHAVSGVQYLLPAQYSECGLFLRIGMMSKKNQDLDAVSGASTCRTIIINSVMCPKRTRICMQFFKCRSILPFTYGALCARLAKIISRQTNAANRHLEVYKLLSQNPTSVHFFVYSISVQTIFEFPPRATAPKRR